jgi:hypothetical protein
LAREKLQEWKERYQEKTEYIPTEAKKMCELMNKIIDITEDIIHDYQPNYQKTKDMLNELEEIKTKFLHEMAELKYLLQ